MRQHRPQEAPRSLPQHGVEDAQGKGHEDLHGCKASDGKGRERESDVGQRKKDCRDQPRQRDGKAGQADLFAEVRG